MTKTKDPAKDPEFQKAVQALLRAPPQPHKPLGKRKPRVQGAKKLGTKEPDHGDR